MKKLLALILAACLCVGVCSCGNVPEGPSPEEQIAEMKQKLDAAETDTELEKVVAEIAKMADVEGAQALLDEATARLDEKYMDRVDMYMTLKDGVTAQEYAEKLSDPVKGAKICVWIDFVWYMQRVHSAVVDNFKQNLKNPNSYTDIGSTYAYDVEPTKEQGKILVKNFSFTLRYTATNSFGGAVQDTYDWKLKDREWSYDSEVLTPEQVCDVLTSGNFDNLMKKLREE